jgi:hypothetical protein
MEATNQSPLIIDGGSDDVNLGNGADSETEDVSAAGSK